VNEKPETPSQVSPKDASFWLSEIEASKSRLEGWYKKADEAEKRYRADENDSDELEFGALNILWSNIETQKAAIGEDFGKPQVTRVNMPEDDGGLARQVALVWERTLAAAVRDTDDNHDIALAVGDLFLPGRGQVWLEVEADDANWVRAPIVRVPYCDYLEGAATRWGGVPWVARRHFFTRDELISECNLKPEDAAKVTLGVQLPYAGKAEKETGEKGKEQFKRAEVWEIWAKFPQKARIYVACGYRDSTLRYDPDPLRLKHFFPCPRPLLANGDEAKPPLTDFSRYQNQAEELDRICQRIFVLTECLRRVGIHDKEFAEIGDLAEVEENTTLAVENWASLQQKGGLNKIQEWLDLVPVIQVLVELHKQRDTLIRLIFELSGISDLARGMTDPQETLGAQMLKKSFGSGRFKRRETETRRFAADAYSLKGEVVAELFSREQIQEMSGIRLPLRQEIDKAKQMLAMLAQQQAAQQAAAQAQQQPQPGGQPAPQQMPQQPAPPPQAPPLAPEEIAALTKLAQTRWSWEDVSGVLRSDYRRCYSVEVETDQSNFADEEAEKQARIQFFQMAMQALQQVGPMIAGNPKSGEIFKQFILFVIGAFKSGRAMEEGIERVIDEGIQMAAQQAGQQQQDPKAVADVQIAQARVQEAMVRTKTAEVGLQEAQVRLQQTIVEAQRAGADIQNEAIAAQAKATESAAKTQASVVASQAKAQDAETKAVQEQQKVIAQHEANAAKREAHLIDLTNREEKLESDRKLRATAEEAVLQGPTRKSEEDAA